MERLMGKEIGRTTESADAFVRAHREWIYRLALQIVGNRDLAEDVTQDSLLRAEKSRSKISQSNAERAWIRQIVVRRAITALSTCKATSEVVDRPTNQDATQDFAVRQTLAKLTPDQQAILALSVGEQLSYEEIADALSIPLGTVASRIHAAKAAFRKLWE